MFTTYEGAEEINQYLHEKQVGERILGNNSERKFELIGTSRIQQDLQGNPLQQKELPRACIRNHIAVDLYTEEQSVLLPQAQRVRGYAQWMTTHLLAGDFDSIQQQLDRLKNCKTRENFFSAIATIDV